MADKRKQKTMEGLTNEQVNSISKELLTIVVADINTFIAEEAEKLNCDKDKLQELIKKVITMYY